MGQLSASLDCPLMTIMLVIDDIDDVNPVYLNT